MRIFLAALALMALTPITAAEPLCAEGVACCKRCKAGKPCGDSCIAADKVCNKPVGCACQG